MSQMAPLTPGYIGQVSVKLKSFAGKKAMHNVRERHQGLQQHRL